MNKIKILILLFLGISTFTYAQNCNCESNFQWVKKTFEENDAGFQYVIDKKGLSAYNAHNTEFLNKIRNVKSDVECTQTIYQWLKFFRSGHIAISPYQTQNTSQTNNNSKLKDSKPWESVKVDFKKFEKYINSKKEADIEGIWETSSYVIAVKKFDNVYKGFIVSAKGLENWKPNDLKFQIGADKKSGTYYLRNKNSQEVKNVELIGKNYLVIDEFTLKRVSPKFENDKAIDTYFKSVATQKPFLEEINNSTLLLRIPTFDGSEKKYIDSVLDANKQKIESKENLIIDLRNNGGGSDNSYSRLIPYIYTNPIRTVRTQMYSTELNNKRMLDLYENYEKYGISKEDREFLKKAYDKLNANLGKFVTIQGNDDGQIISEEKLDKVLPYPKNIGIIINNNNGSTTEQFLLAAKQSKKVKLFGTTTMGVLDISNMNFVDSPCKEFQLGYSLSKSLRIPDMAIDEKGIQPDYYIDKSIPEYKWVDFVNGILNEK